MPEKCVNEEPLVVLISVSVSTNQELDLISTGSGYPTLLRGSDVRCQMLRFHSVWMQLTLERPVDFWGSKRWQTGHQLQKQWELFLCVKSQQRRFVRRGSIKSHQMNDILKAVIFQFKKKSRTAICELQSGLCGAKCFIQNPAGGLSSSRTIFSFSPADRKCIALLSSSYLSRPRSRPDACQSSGWAAVFLKCSNGFCLLHI